MVLVDQHDFPRDKTCGDGLIPDAYRALQRMGVLGEVLAAAQPISHLRCIGPRGGHIDVPGTMAVLPRRILDHILFQAAVRAGAHAATPVRFEAPLLEGERVVGARLKAGGQTVELRAPWVVLATGAVPQALIAAGLCERHTPDGVAIRGYVKNDAIRGRIDKLEVIWHQRLSGGYGWIFPAPDGLFNIGTGVVGSHEMQGDGKGTMRGVNLREMFAAFCAIYPKAGELVQGGTMVGELKGAPLRCSLRGARWSRPGLLVSGEAAGSTYAFTGEGIGKALETGLLAAETLLEGGSDAAIEQRYASTLRALQPRFDLYEKAQHVNNRPWLVDFVIWRGNKSERIRRRMAGVLEETSNPGNILSWRGLTRLVLE